MDNTVIRVERNHVPMYFFFTGYLVFWDLRGGPYAYFPHYLLVR